MAEVIFSKWQTFGARVALYDALAATLADDIRGAVAARGQMLFGASGGSTPKPVYQRLAAMDLPWSKFIAVIVDERFVPLDNESSNQRMIEESLLQGHADARCVGLWSNAVTLDAAVESAADRVRALAAPMDSVVLGMGEDGHFASCFPTAKAFSAAIDPNGDAWVLPISPMPADVHPAIERLTLTWSYIRRAKRIVLAITGMRKQQVLQQAMRDEDAYQLPIAALFKPGMPNVDIYWSE